MHEASHWLSLQAWRLATSTTHCMSPPCQHHSTLVSLFLVKALTGLILTAESSQRASSLRAQVSPHLIDYLYLRFVLNLLNTLSPGIVVRLWSKELEGDAAPKLVTVWGLYFSGLVFLGSQLPKESSLFASNTLIFGMTWGYFVDPKSLKSQSVFAATPQVEEGTTSSYSLSSMCR